MTLSRAQILARIAQELTGIEWLGLLGIDPAELAALPTPDLRWRTWPAAGAPALPDLAVLAALQVSAAGDVLLDTQLIGAELLEVVDVLSRAPRVLCVVLGPVSSSRPSLVEAWSDDAPAPRAGRGLRRVAHRVLTEHGLLDITPEGLVIRELAPGWSARKLQELVAPTLHIAPDVAELGPRV